jgi:short-subunit dehydrogenase
MRRNLAGKRILITGASSGIGRCLAEEAARRGAKLVLMARSADRLETLSLELSRRGAIAIAVPGDVTLASDRERVIETTRRELGGLDVLINNAGVASFGHFATSSEAIMRQVMEVNFFAPAELIRIAIPLLTEGDQPAIVNLASMCGRRGIPAWPEYSASKFALCGLTEALRGEMARFEIDVLLIVPGLTASSLPEHLLRNEGRMQIGFTGGMTPQSVAARTLDALEKNRAESVLGREAKQLLLANVWLPRLVDRLLKRRVQALYAQKG